MESLTQDIITYHLAVFVRMPDVLALARANKHMYELIRPNVPKIISNYLVYLANSGGWLPEKFGQKCIKIEFIEPIWAPGGQVFISNLTKEISPVNLYFLQYNMQMELSIDNIGPNITEKEVKVMKYFDMCSPTLVALAAINTVNEKMLEKVIERADCSELIIPLVSLPEETGLFAKFGRLVVSKCYSNLPLLAQALKIAENKDFGPAINEISGTYKTYHVADDDSWLGNSVMYDHLILSNISTSRPLDQEDVDYFNHLKEGDDTLELPEEYRAEIPEEPDEGWKFVQRLLNQDESEQNVTSDQISGEYEELTTGGNIPTIEDKLDYKEYDYEAEKKEMNDYRDYVMINEILVADPNDIRYKIRSSAELRIHMMFKLYQYVVSDGPDFLQLFKDLNLDQNEVRDLVKDICKFGRLKQLQNVLLWGAEADLALIESIKSGQVPIITFLLKQYSFNLPELENAVELALILGNNDVISTLLPVLKIISGNMLLRAKNLNYEPELFARLTKTIELLPKNKQNTFYDRLRQKIKCDMDESGPPEKVGPENLKDNIL